MKPMRLPWTRPARCAFIPAASSDITAMQNCLRSAAMLMGFNFLRLRSDLISVGGSLEFEKI